MATTRNAELVFVPLGGVGEIGMNFALYGYGPRQNREWIVVDVGVTFPGARPARRRSGAARHALHRGERRQPARHRHHPCA